MVLNTPLNPLLTNIPILYPLKTLENQRFSGEWEYWTEMGYINLVKPQLMLWEFSKILHQILRSCRSQMLFKIVALKNMPNFTRKAHVLESLDLKLYLKRYSGTGVFQSILHNILENFFIEHLRWLLLGTTK